MSNLNEFIEQERKKKEVGVQNPANVRMSLMALKNAVDGHTHIDGNPLIENIKRVDNFIQKKDGINGFVEPSISKQPIQNNTPVSYDEKDDKFTKDLLMKTREFVSGGGYINEQPKQQLREEFIQPDITPQYKTQKSFNPIQEVSKSEAMDILKDTITDLYVKEKVEGIIKEYIKSDEGKQLIKNIVVGLFKKK